MKLIIPILFLIGMIMSGFASQMAIVEDSEKGILTVKDGKVNVLT